MNATGGSTEEGLPRTIEEEWSGRLTDAAQAHAVELEAMNASLAEAAKELWVVE